MYRDVLNIAKFKSKIRFVFSTFGNNAHLKNVFFSRNKFVESGMKV